MHSACDLPREICEGLKTTLKSTISERAIPSWDYIGSEKKLGLCGVDKSFTGSPTSQHDVPSYKEGST
jgi:hypothetical protein